MVPQAPYQPLVSEDEEIVTESVVEEVSQPETVVVETQPEPQVQVGPQPFSPLAGLDDILDDDDIIVDTKEGENSNEG